jgi:hypothetical protein
MNMNSPNNYVKSAIAALSGDIARDKRDEKALVDIYNQE